MTQKLQADCELCNSTGGEILCESAQFRVVLIDDANYPGFCRLIWREHQAEVTDLHELDRMLMMDVLWQIETVVRAVMQPKKINLAALGNQVPHIHCHVIPRFEDDAFFPGSAWSNRLRDTSEATLKIRRQQALELPKAIRAAIATLS